MGTKELVTYYMRKVIDLYERIQFLNTITFIPFIRKERLGKRELTGISKLL